MDQDTERDALTRYVAASDALATLTFEAFSDTELLGVLRELEVADRRRAALSHLILARLHREANPVALGGKSWKSLLADRLKISARDAQRRVDHARDLGCAKPGCTKPGCTVPAYGTQVHHTNGWVRNRGRTNVDEEVLACGPDNRLAEHGWTVTITPEGVQWIPPPELDTGQPRVNYYHHPERLLGARDGAS